MRNKSVVIGVAALICLAAVAVAQEEPVYTWINFLKAKPGQGDALIQMMIEEDSKQFNPLVDGGQAVNWGIAMPVVHNGGDPYSHVEWISFRGWSGADSFMAKFMEMRQTMSQEDLKAMGEKWEALVVPGSHYDAINRNIHVGPGETGRPGYIHLGYYKAKWGQSEPAKKFYDDVAVPVYDKLVADGEIINYGLHVPAVHHGEEWTHMGWYSSEALAARDAVSAAFDAADAARSEEENAKMMERWGDIFEPEAHSDQILMVVHYYRGGEGGEE